MCVLKWLSDKKTDSECTLGHSILDIKSTYKYLGVVFDEYLEFRETAKTLAGAGGRALGKVYIH